jgi:hypothetical protein
MVEQIRAACGDVLAVSNIDETASTDWELILRSNVDLIGGFEGSIDRAAQLLARFGQGRRLVKDYFAQKVQVDYPDIWLTYNEPKKYWDHAMGDFSHLDQQGSAIQTSFLALASREYTEEVTDFSHFGNTSFYASPSDIFFLAGVEETHHAIYRQLHLGPEDFLGRDIVFSAPEYALESEWQALHYKIQFARATNVADFVVNQMVVMKEYAATYRKSQGLSIDTVPYLS